MRIQPQTPMLASYDSAANSDATNVTNTRIYNFVIIGEGDHNLSTSPHPSTTTETSSHRLHFTISHRIAAEWQMATTDISRNEWENRWYGGAEHSWALVAVRSTVGERGCHGCSSARRLTLSYDGSDRLAIGTAPTSANHCSYSRPTTPVFPHFFRPQSLSSNHK